MDLLKSYRLYFTVLGGILFFILPLWKGSTDIRYSKASTIPIEWDDVLLDTLVFQDSLAENDLYLLKDSTGIPLFYAQDIMTEVCFDSKCRLLNITVQWNITGRYLGFSLANGEYLSKQEHEAFSVEEYERLNDLLADATLSLGGISFEELIMKPETEEQKVDGVTSATTADVSQMVVKGAAYTTYTLWNIVHGHTKDLVASITEKGLSQDLIIMILDSPDLSDKVWALNRINKEKPMSTRLSAVIVKIISDGDFFLSYSAINALGSLHLYSDTLQDEFFSTYEEAKPSIKSMLVEKLMEAPHLSADVVSDSRKLITAVNGKQIGDFLDLYIKHGVYDVETLKVVATLLNSENRFISRQAHQFLKKSPLSHLEIETLRQNH